MKNVINHKYQNMDRNSCKTNQNQKEENKKKKNTNKPTYFWVSYPDYAREEKAKLSSGDSLLERSNRFAL